MAESKEIITMRAMAWERAKGELNSMKYTYLSESGSAEKFLAFDKKLEEFIKYVEDNGLEA